MVKSVSSTTGSSTVANLRTVTLLRANSMTFSHKPYYPMIQLNKFSKKYQSDSTLKLLELWKCIDSESR